MTKAFLTKVPVSSALATDEPFAVYCCSADLDGAQEMFKAALQDCPREEVAAVTRIRRYIQVSRPALPSSQSTISGSMCPDSRVLFRDAWASGSSLTFCRRRHRHHANFAGLSALKTACQMGSLVHLQCMLQCAPSCAAY